MAKKTVSKKAASVPSTRKASVLGDEPFLPKGYVNTGEGTSDRAEDQLIPIISILQTLSPQLKKSKPEYIEDAEVGMFFFKNCEPPVRPGDEGFYFIPALFKSMEYVEWVPRDSGGGYVARHDKLPANVKTIKDDKNPNKMKHVGPNGNEFIETRYVYGMALDSDLEPIGNFVIPFSSTGHQVWKTWNQRAKNKILNDGSRASPWLYVYKLTTEEKTNAAGDWYIIKVEDAGWNTNEELILQGKELHRSVSAGEKVAMAEERGSGSDTM